MKRVKLHFTLVGKTDEWRRGHNLQEWTNRDSFDLVKDTVISHFGSGRPMLMINEDSLRSSGSAYPEYYAAGWFITEDKPLSELVVVAHGDSMASAKKFLLDAVNMVDWDNEARLVEE